MPTRTARAAVRQRGLTLIELMVSITLGLLILAALGYTYVGSRGTYRTSENLARMQDAGRTALQFITEDVRMSSFYGCRSRIIQRQEINVIATTPPDIGVAPAEPPLGVRGFETGDESWGNPTTIARVRGDVVRIWRAEASQGAALTVDTNPVARTATIANNAANLRTNELVLVADCNGAAIFRITNNPPRGIGAVNVELQYGGAANGPSFAMRALADRPEAFRFAQTSYFIGSNPAGRPALYRTDDTGNAEEIVDNVEDMDVVFGIDTDGDFVAERYSPPGGVAPGEWPRVVSVRVSLLVAGPEQAAALAPQTYLLRDVNNDGVLDAETAADTRLRQVFASTVAIRNRTQ